MDENFKKTMRDLLACQREGLRVLEKFVNEVLEYEKILPVPKKENHYTFYTDGACSNNGKHGAKASRAFYCIEHDFLDAQLCNTVDQPTNNIAELKAIQFALLYAFSETVVNPELNAKDLTIKIYSDSQYAIKSLTEWDIEKKTKGQKKKNYELIKQIQNEIDHFKKVEFEWVKGHDGNTYNEKVDQAAQRLLYL